MNGKLAAALVVAGAALSGCESVPMVRFHVWEATDAALTESGRPVTEAKFAPSGPPVANAVILRPMGRWKGDPVALAARIRDDPTLTERMHPPIGSDGDGAYAMRTGRDGTAEYSELLLGPWFSAPRPVERRFVVWAEGYELREVTIGLDLVGGWVSVPLVRSSGH